MATSDHQAPSLASFEARCPCQALVYRLLQLGDRVLLVVRFRPHHLLGVELGREVAEQVVGAESNDQEDWVTELQQPVHQG